MHFIHNRHNLKMAVLVQQPPKQRGLVFIMHGLGGVMNQTQFATIAPVFIDAHYTVVRFDTTNSFGQSEGHYEDATTTGYYHDLEDVIAWATKQPWYVEPFVLVGHSVGGLCTAMFAQKHPQKVQALSPLSTVVSGKLRLQTITENEALEWQKTGSREYKSSTTPGRMKRLPWSHMEDAMHYDLLPEASKLVMPVLMVVGSEDDRTPLKQQQLLYKALPGPKELHIIEGARHNFKEESHLHKLASIFAAWIHKYLT